MGGPLAEAQGLELTVRNQCPAPAGAGDNSPQLSVGCSHEAQIAHLELPEGKEIDAEIAYWQLESAAPFDDDHASTLIRHFAATLADIRALIDSDIDAAFIGDPAARSVDEILVSYPGAIATQRMPWRP